MAVHVVPITPAAAAFDQVADLFDEYRVHYGQPASQQATRDWLRDQVVGHSLQIVAALDGDHACGFVTITVMPASLILGSAWSIRDLFVAPPHRRSGVARALLEYVISSARAAGAHRVSLQTETDNLAALALYTAIGFEPVTELTLLTLTLGAVA